MLPIARCAALLAAAVGMLAGGVGRLGVASASGADESCFLADVNAARATAGLATLSVNQDLASIARAHSAAMSSAGRLSHNSELAMVAPSNWTALGENVGTGPSCDAINRGLLNDPPHRAIILDPAFNTLGVGVAPGADGSIYVTEDFMQGPSGASVPAPAPSRPPTLPVVAALAQTRPPGVSPSAQPTARPAVPGKFAGAPRTASVVPAPIRTATPIAQSAPAGQATARIGFTSTPAPSQSRGLLSTVLSDLELFFEGQRL